MRASTPWARRWLVTLLVLLTATLSGCGDSDDDKKQTPSTSTLGGTAATGAPMVGYVYVTGVSGAEVNTAINTDGSWIVEVTGMTGPFLVRAVPNDTSLPTQYSYASSANITVNVTPLTTMTLFLANGKQDLAALVSGWSNAQINASALQTAQAQINANFASQFQAQNLDASTYDFFKTEFDTNGTGFDAVLDGILVEFDMSGGSFAVTVGGNAYNFDVNIDTSGIDIGGSSDSTGDGDSGDGDSGDGDSGNNTPVTINMDNCTLQANNNYLCTPSALAAFGPTTITDTSSSNTCTVDYDGNGTLHFTGGGQADTLTISQFAMGGALPGGPANIADVAGKISLHINSTAQIDHVLRVNANFTSVQCLEVNN